MIINNNHLLRNSKLYLQKEGSSQYGTSRLLADLYLHHYESKFKNNNTLLFRYIDDYILISFNDVLTFDLPVKYPLNLKLTFNVVQNNYLHFLDLNIHLLNTKIHLNIL